MRCAWCGDDPLYVRYHDEEWGVPSYCDKKHFEFLVLESAQAGLSWLCILRKREHYKKAFVGFDYEQVANFGEPELGRLLKNKGIVRNRRKIAAAVQNARRFLEVRSEFGSFSRYIWSFVDGRAQQNAFASEKDVPAQTATSRALSVDMKKRGFQCVGPIVLYSHMQALGLVNDHVRSCFRYLQTRSQCLHF